MRRRWIALAFVPILGMLVMLSAGATATPAPKWPTPAPNAPIALAAVAAISPTDAWAVGTQDGAYIQHWDGTSWTAAAVPAARELLGVAAASASDVWAVGCCSPTKGYKLLTMHWDGTSWSAIAAPGLGHQTPCTLHSVTALADGSAWAAGDCWGGEGPGLIEHWDGTAWHIVYIAPEQWAISSISASSESDVWAVGYRYRHGAADLALTLHWSGTRWHRVRSPHPARYSTKGVSAVAPGDAWTAGSSWHKPAIAEHWDGSQWIPLEVRSHHATYSNLNSVSLASADEGWAGGFWSTEQHTGALLEHWDGSAWSAFRGPTHDAHGRSIEAWNAVESSSTTDAWAVGTTEDSSFNQHGVLAHWNGRRWTLNWSDSS